MQQTQQPGEQQPQDQPGNADKPVGGQESNTEGQNRDGTKPPDNETGPGSQASGSEQWGNLPPYLNKLKNRGSAPKVPAKYRKYWQAYLKNKRAQQRGN